MHRFKVFPGKDNWMTKEESLFWQVDVCRNKSAMFRRGSAMGVTGPNNYSAIVCPRTRYKYPHRRPEPLLGYVLFNEKCIFEEVVAHEAVHMAAWYLRRTRVSLNLGRECDDREERLAYATGSCANQLSIALHELRIL